MTDYNKKSIVQGAVILIAALVAFFTLILFDKAGWPWWAVPFTASGAGYGIYCFIKNFYPKD